MRLEITERRRHKPIRLPAPNECYFDCEGRQARQYPQSGFAPGLLSFVGLLGEAAGCLRKTSPM